MIIYCLASCIGLTYIIKYGSIIAPIRKKLCKLNFFAELFACSLCIGFHVGWIHALLYLNQGAAPLMEAILMPFVSAGVCWFADSVLDLIQVNTAIKYIELKTKRSQQVSKSCEEHV